MKKQLITIAIVATLSAAMTGGAYANEFQTNPDDHQHAVGTSIGAVTGALFAGPVGFVAGGLIGNLAARHNASHSTPTEISLSDDRQSADASTPSANETDNTDPSPEPLMLAQSGAPEPVINEARTQPSAELAETIVNDMQLDVFFLSGSTAIETFFLSRIQAVVSLLEQMPDVDVHLEGFSDRRGNNEDNLELANQRLDAVRTELLAAGVATNRIHLNAFGEQQFNSEPGDLEAYTFDRRVVIRFAHRSAPTDNQVTLTESTTTH